MTTDATFDTAAAIKHITALYRAENPADLTGSARRDAITAIIHREHTITEAAALFVETDRNLPTGKSDSQWFVWQAFKFAVLKHADQEAATLHQEGNLTGLLAMVTEFGRDWGKIDGADHVVRMARTEAATHELWEALRNKIGTDAFNLWVNVDLERMYQMMDNDATNAEIDRATMADIAAQLGL